MTMNDVDLRSTGQPLCEWTDASGKFALHLDPDVIGRLGIESWMAFKQVPRRGLEIGGILLGRIELGENTTSFRVEGFQAIECEHRSGPSYLLSESDFGRLQDEIRKSGAASLGIFRSQTRSECLVSEPSDIEMFRKCFKPGRGLFLMLGPVPGKAAIFTRAEGELKCVHEFALPSSMSSILALHQSRSSAQASPHPRPSRERRLKIGSGVPPPLPALSPEQLIRSVVLQEPVHPPLVNQERAQPLTPVPEFNEKRRPPVVRRAWVIAASTAFLALGAVTGVLARSLYDAAPHYLSALRYYSAPGEQSVSNVLRLTVHPDGSSLRLLWDPSAPAVRGAARAVLHIQDGDYQSDRELASAELNAGDAAYQPKTANVTFRLDVYPAEPNATGVIQVVNYSTAPVIPPAGPVGHDYRPPSWQLPVTTAREISVTLQDQQAGGGTVPLAAVSRQP
jgi:hypothetical protein